WPSAVMQDWKARDTSNGHPSWILSDHPTAPFTFFIGTSDHTEPIDWAPIFVLSYSSPLNLRTVPL
ncbi:3438_t:CDS:1, partial [Acaulospora colombiana]